jgi:mono/diheme cytochrome c family protein
VVDSEMLANLSDEESNLVTTYILSLQSDEIHKSYRRIDKSNPSKISDDEGHALYKTYCIACHTTGKDSVYDEIFKRTIPAIMNPAFLRAADDKLLKTVISEGRADTQMTAWKTDAAGLASREIDKIIKYLTRDRPKTKPAPFAFAKFDGNIKYGEDLYKVRCTGCHGEKGQGGVGINLRNPVVQNLFDPEFLAITVRDGRDGTHMVAFGRDGVGFADQDIVDVISYVKTFGTRK